MTRISLFILLLILLSSCSPRATDYDQVRPEDKLVIKFSHVTGEDTPKGLAAQRFKELVEKRSNGKVEVQVFPNSTLYSDTEELKELKSGGVQLIAPAISKLSNIVPEVQYFDLPYIFTSPEEVWTAVDGPIGKKIGLLFEQQGFRLLTTWDNGFKQMINNQRPIRDPQHFNGLNFRIMGSEVLSRQFDVVGAQSKVIPFHKLYVSLEQEEVQGVENTFSNIYHQKLYKLQKYITKSDHGYLGYFVLTNPIFWNQIPRDTREMLEETLKEVTQWERRKAIEIDQRNYQNIRNVEGLEIIELSPAEKRKWKNAFIDTYRWYSKNIDELLNHEFMGR